MLQRAHSCCHAQAERVCLPRSASLAHVHSLACAKTGRQPNHFQLRPWVGRGNDTIRPADVLFKGRNLQQALAPGNITYAGGVCPKTGIKIFYMFWEEVDDAVCLFSLVAGTHVVLLFLKLWDPAAGTIKVCPAPFFLIILEGSSGIEHHHRLTAARQHCQHRAQKSL